MTKQRAIDQMFARLGVVTTKTGNIGPDTHVDVLEVCSATIEQLVHRANTVLDQLETLDFQATRWRTQRDEALAKVEALEKQNDMLAEHVLLRTEASPYACSHYGQIGTPDGWRCVNCHKVVEPNPIDPRWNY